MCKAPRRQLLKIGPIRQSIVVACPQRGSSALPSSRACTPGLPKPDWRSLANKAIVATEEYQASHGV
jgi:hypothetical protein